MPFNSFSKTFGFNAYLFPSSLALLKPAATARATKWRVLFNGNLFYDPADFLRSCFFCRQDFVGVVKGD